MEAERWGFWDVVLGFRFIFFILRFGGGGFILVLELSLFLDVGFWGKRFKWNFTES